MPSSLFPTGVNKLQNQHNLNIAVDLLHIWFINSLFLGGYVMRMREVYGEYNLPGKKKKVSGM